MGLLFFKNYKSHPKFFLKFCSVPFEVQMRFNAKSYLNFKT